MFKSLFTLILCVSCLNASFTNLDLAKEKAKLDKDKYRLGLVFSSLEKELKFTTTEKEEVLIDLNGRVFNYLTDTRKEYKFFLTGSSLKTYFMFRLDKIWYEIGYRVFELGELRISESDKILSTSYGNEYSIGFWKILFPYTIVSNEILLGLNSCFVNQSLNFLESNSIKYKIDSDLRLYEFSFSLVFLRNISKLLDLKYGFDITHRNFLIIDKYNYFKISGRSYSSSVNVGGVFNLTNRERVSFEFSFSLQRELKTHISYLIKF